MLFYLQITTKAHEVMRSHKIRELYPNYIRIIHFFCDAEPNAELFGLPNFDRIKSK